MSFKLADLMKRAGPPYGAGPAAFKRLLKRLGNPQEKFKAVHVAGTNGKGSVCHLCAEVLQAAGHRTGLFVSPHVTDIRERVRINGQLISRRMLGRLCQEVLAAEEEKLNFFEILTAAAFLYFARRQVDYAVVETGLGGAKDPTSSCAPVACLITSVGLDHCHLLGNTLAQIAREKAGILKSGVPCFCAPLEASAAAEVKKAAEAAGAPLFFCAENAPFSLYKIDWQRGRQVLQKGRSFWSLALMGEKQVQNACLVYSACRFLGVSKRALRQGFARVQVPGRFEIFRTGNKTLILDGAHNPQAVESLMRFWVQSPWTDSAALVCGFMKDKDYPHMLDLLLPYFDDVFFTLSLIHI